MKKQRTSSGCGFACSSSFRNAVVMCSSCRTKKKLSEDEILGNPIVRGNVGKIGMILGNLTFESALSIPLILAAADHHFYSGKPSTLHIKQEHEGEESGVAEAEKEALWDSSKVKKKRRSKLPKHSVSSQVLARFIKQIQRAWSPKYDDVLIYQKCLYLAENEIGLGAELLPPQAVYEATRRTTSLVIKEEPNDIIVLSN